MVADILIAAWVLAFCLGGWMTHALLMPHAARVIPSMRKLAAPAPAEWPRVSVIVPACNEADTLEAALASLLAEDYPALEIILVDDRSTDGTGALVDAIAARDPRVVPLHVTALPEGWLGKVHALDQGMRRASGEWVLLTDADVVFTPGTLRQVVAWALHEGKDFVTALPDVRARGVVHQATVLALGELMGVAARIWEIGRAGSKAFAGVGPFNLVRRAVYDRSPGLEWLRMEVSEDIGVGLLMHEAGARAAILNGRDALIWTWYPTLGHMVRGLEKNTFGLIGQYRYWQAAAMVVLLALTVAAPFVGLFAGHDLTWVRVVAGAALALHLVYGVGYARWLGRSIAAGLMIPFGKLVVAWVLARSAWAFRKRDGVEWRGTRYPRQALEAGRRVKR